MWFSKKKSINSDSRSIGLNWEIGIKVQAFTFVFKVIKPTFVEGYNKTYCNDLVQAECILYSDWYCYITSCKSGLHHNLIYERQGARDSSKGNFEGFYFFDLTMAVTWIPCHKIHHVPILNRRKLSWNKNKQNNLNYQGIYNTGRFNSENKQLSRWSFIKVKQRPLWIFCELAILCSFNTVKTKIW